MKITLKNGIESVYFVWEKFILRPSERGWNLRFMFSFSSPEWRRSLTQNLLCRDLSIADIYPQWSYIQKDQKKLFWQDICIYLLTFIKYYERVMFRCIVVHSAVLILRYQNQTLSSYTFQISAVNRAAHESTFSYTSNELIVRTVEFWSHIFWRGVMLSFWLTHSAEKPLIMCDFSSV